MNEIPLGTAGNLAGMMANAGLSEHPHRASGIEGIDNFQTKPSSETIIFEANSDIFGMKVTDSNNNVTSRRYFVFKEISREEAMREISPYIMKGELDSFKTDIVSAVRSELSSFKEDILNGQQFIRGNSKPVTNNSNGSSAIRSPSETK